MFSLIDMPYYDTKHLKDREDHRLSTFDFDLIKIIKICDKTNVIFVNSDVRIKIKID